MIALTFWIGGILTATGLAAYAITGAESVTSLIPAVVGILLLIAGAVAARIPNARRHAVHAALLVAVLGALGSLMNVAQVGDLISGDAERPAAIIVSLIMLVLLLVYIGAGVQSFVAARKNR